jgi:type I restriction enzyme R subunit
MKLDNIGKPERVSQKRVIQLFQNELGYTYLGDWVEEIEQLESKKARYQNIKQGLM